MRPTMKNSVALALLTIALFVSACGSPQPIYIPASPGGVVPSAGTVSVDAMGKVEIEPDFATLEIRFSRKKPTQEGAREALHRAIIQLSDNLEKFEIVSTDLSFSSVGIKPIIEWSADRRTQETVAYEAYKTSNVIIRDLSRLGEVANGVLDVSGDLGNISDITFDVDDSTEFEAQARAIALQKANAKAEQLVDGTTSKIGSIRSLTESIGRPTSLLSKEVLFARINSGHSVRSGAKLYATVRVQMVYDVRP